MTRRLVSRRAPRDERGAILLLSVAGVVLAMVASALAVDLGFVSQMGRENQKIADLAALDGAKVLPADPTAAAVASAVRNGYSETAPITVECAPTTAGPFVTGLCVSGNSGAVKVTVLTTHENAFPFVGDGVNVTRVAKAAKRDNAGFSLGSSLASLTSPTLLNGFMGGMIGGGLNLSLVGWQGIASSTMTLSALQTELLALGAGVGTFDELMTTDVTLAQLYEASANVLSNQGLGSATALDTLSLAANGSRSMKLGDLFTISHGGDAALGMAFDVYQLVTGSAQIANGANAVSVSNLGVAIPNVLTTGVSLTVIEPPQIAFGPVGTTVSTGQVQLAVTPQLNLSFNIGFIPGYSVQSNLPVTATIAGADGTIKAISCAASTTMTITVDPEAGSGSIANNLVVKLLGLDILTLPVSGSFTIANPPAVDRTFTMTAPTPVFSPTTDHYAGTSFNLGGVTLTPGSPVVLGFLGLGVTTGQIVNAVTSRLPAVMTNLDGAINTALSPVLRALGLGIGNADTTPLAIECGRVALV